MATATQPEEQIIGVLKQVEAGRTVTKVARELGCGRLCLYRKKINLSKIVGRAGRRYQRSRQRHLAG